MDQLTFGAVVPVTEWMPAVVSTAFHQTIISLVSTGHDHGHPIDLKTLKVWVQPDGIHATVSPLVEPQQEPGDVPAAAA